MKCQVLFSWKKIRKISSISRLLNLPLACYVLLENYVSWGSVFYRNTLMQKYSILCGINCLRGITGFEGISAYSVVTLNIRTS